MNPVSEDIYRFFAAFPGFLDGIPLGYEARLPTDTWGPCALGAVFSADAQYVKTRSYINGGGIRRGMCTVTLIARDNDTAARLWATALFSALCAYVASDGSPYISPDGEVYTVRADTAPIRAFRLAGGAAWEMRYTYERKETK